MELEKLHKVKIIFEQALKIDSDKRNDFLNEQCENDDEIKNEDIPQKPLGVREAEGKVIGEE